MQGNYCQVMYFKLKKGSNFAGLPAIPSISYSYISSSSLDISNTYQKNILKIRVRQIMCMPPHPTAYGKQKLLQRFTYGTTY